MNFKKKILIVGPISDFGGREVMTDLLVSSLKDTYYVNVLSTISMTKNSSALKSIDSDGWETVNYYLYRHNFVLRFTALLTKFINQRKEPAYFFITNKFTKPIFNFTKLYYRTIKKFVFKSDLIVCSNEINGKWLNEIIEMSQEGKKPLLIRITGEIKYIPSFLTKTILSLNILVHSKQNSFALQECFKNKVIHIDQTTALETFLLNLEIKENDLTVYGFLGRFSQEKGIEELIHVFSGNNKKLVIAGNGPLLKEVQSACNEYENIQYLGKLSPNELQEFFDKIDVLVIASFEEGGPIVGIEAMAAGKLIISTKVGAMPERLDKTENDFWFSHENKNSLQTVIEDVENLSKEKRLRIRSQVRKKYLTHNAFNIIKKQYLNLVQEIMK